MTIESFTQSAFLLFVLLNPFLMSIYLMDLIQRMDFLSFTSVLVRGSAIAGSIFILFAWGGDRIFTDLLQARFAAFLIFGGVIFLIIGVRFVFSGTDALQSLRGDPEHLAGSIAMPFMIGPGTISASVLAGSRLSPLWSALAIVVVLVAVVLGLVLLKAIHDYVSRQNQRLVDRYLDVTGRIMALVIGTFAVEMIVQGVEALARSAGLIDGPVALS